MQIKVTQSNLVQALNTVSRSISTKPQLPILSCLLLKAENNQISLFATDINLGIRCQIFGEIEKEGSVAIPAKIFIEVVKTLGQGDLTLKVDEHTLSIIASKTKTKIQCQPHKEFPEFPETPPLKGSFKAAQLKVIEKYVSFSTSIDQTRLVLTTLLFRQAEDFLQVVGTDGFRLSTLKLKEELKQVGQFLIANKAFLEIVKISDAQNAENILFEVSDELKQVFFLIGEVEFFVRLIEGSYPPFEKIIPPDFILTGSFDGPQFEDALKQASVFAKEVSNVVSLEISGDKMKITSNASAKGSYQGEIPVKLETGETGRVAFNIKYLIDFLGNVKPERVWFGMNDELKPVMFKEEGNKFFEYVVMPFRLNS